jgi:hypothetical protein
MSTHTSSTFRTSFTISPLGRTSVSECPLMGLTTRAFLRTPNYKWTEHLWTTPPRPLGFPLRLVLRMEMSV